MAFDRPRANGDYSGSLFVRLMLRSIQFQTSEAREALLLLRELVDVLLAELTTREQSKAASSLVGS